MIRLIQRRLIIPRGDTGSFSIPINNEVKNSQANLKRTEYIIKGTIVLIIILIIVF